MRNNPRYKKRVRAKIWRRRIIALAVIAALVVGICLLAKSCKTGGGGEPLGSDIGGTGSDSPSPVVQTATVASTGDLLLHDRVLQSCLNGSEYSFDAMFSEIKPYYTSFDYTVMNLEVTLGGTEAGKYRGYPGFNSPDNIIDTLKGVGVNSLLFANNHAYDTGKSGFLRTMRVLSEKQIDFMGARKQASDKKYIIKEINGIKIGMVCYTYATKATNGNIALNGITMASDVQGLVNTFRYDNLSAFYSEISEIYTQMKNEGADATMIYVHWGNEYQYSPNSYQKQMAQKLSDTGFDVIVGGHPHVIQPMTTLTGSGGNKTVCLYSMGNALSNQRKDVLDADKSGHTEDGLIFSVKFQKENGITRIAEVDIMPTWVDLQYKGGKYYYRVIPLDTAVADWSAFNLNVADAKASYNRTMKLVGEGLNSWRTQNGLEAKKISVQ